MENAVKFLEWATEPFTFESDIDFDCRGRYRRVIPLSLDVKSASKDNVMWEVMDENERLKQLHEAGSVKQYTTAELYQLWKTQLQNNLICKKTLKQSWI